MKTVGLQSLNRQVSYYVPATFYSFAYVYSMGVSSSHQVFIHIKREIYQNSGVYSYEARYALMAVSNLFGI